MRQLWRIRRTSGARGGSLGLVGELGVGYNSWKARDGGRR